MDNERIYMDNAATTRTDPEVVEAMKPYFTETYAVASSQFSHTPGIMAKEGLEKARQIIAGRMSASPEELVFTSGGTESNNLALKGLAWAQKEKKHLICSKIEHNSVLHTCQWLETQGFDVTYLDVDEEGFIDLEQLKSSITDQTFLVSVQHANQEVGTLQPVQQIAEIVKEKGALYHMDASLSFTHLDIDLSTLPADLVTMSAHKIHGPNGVGALFVREGVKMNKLFHGGYSEGDRRPGTENVAGAVGFGKAVEIATAEQTQYVRQLQATLINRLEADVTDLHVNGPRDLERRLPTNVNVSFNLVEGESVVLHLDMKGVSVITGSACFSRSLEPSYVMMALGFTHERAHGSIRYTLSRFNRMSEIETVSLACKEIVEKLREISPLKK